MAADPHAWIAFITLAALEIVLGVDNIIFISILVGRLPERPAPARARPRARFAMLTRIGLLLSLAWVMTLTEPLFSIPVSGKDIAGRDLILIGGGLFLLWKSVHEIHNSLEGEETSGEQAAAPRARGFAAVIVQIGIIDIVFSLDSVITAVGMVDQVAIMVLAIVAAVVVMMFAARPIGEFVDRHPTVKMLALSFLILVGVALIAEGWDLHIPRATSTSRWRSRWASRCSTSACAPGAKRSGCAGRARTSQPGLLQLQRVPGSGRRLRGTRCTREIRNLAFSLLTARRQGSTLDKSLIAVHPTYRVFAATLAACLLVQGWVWGTTSTVDHYRVWVDGVQLYAAGDPSGRPHFVHQYPATTILVPAGALTAAGMSRRFRVQGHDGILDRASRRAYSRDGVCTATALAVVGVRRVAVRVSAHMRACNRSHHFGDAAGCPLRIANTHGARESGVCIADAGVDRNLWRYHACDAARCVGRIRRGECVLPRMEAARWLLGGAAVRSGDVPAECATSAAGPAQAHFACPCECAGALADRPLDSLFVRPFRISVRRGCDAAHLLPPRHAPAARVPCGFCGFPHDCERFHNARPVTRQASTAVAFLSPVFHLGAAAAPRGDRWPALAAGNNRAARPAPSGNEQNETRSGCTCSTNAGTSIFSLHETPLFDDCSRCSASGRRAPRAAT